MEEPCNSATVHCRSSLKADRRPRRINGNFSVHLTCWWHFRDCFKERWKRSTRPLLIEWYGVVRIWCMPRDEIRELKSDDMNCRPWSVVMTAETPKRDIQCSIKTAVTVFEAISQLAWFLAILWIDRCKWVDRWSLLKVVEDQQGQHERGRTFENDDWMYELDCGYVYRS